MPAEPDPVQRSLTGAVVDPYVSPDAMRWQPDRAGESPVLTGMAGFWDFLNLPLPRVPGVAPETVQRVLSGAAGRVAEEVGAAVGQLRDATRDTGRRAGLLDEHGTWSRPRRRG